MLSPPKIPSGQIRDVLERMDPAFLADALASLGLGYWSWDLASNKVVWSENMGEILGLPEGSLAGDFDSFLSLLHPEDQPRFQASIDRALSGGGNYEVEFRVWLRIVRMRHYFLSFNFVRYVSS